jgi:cyanobactin maturation PatA/PatG family protease
MKMTQESLLSIPGLRDCRQQTLGDPEICIAIIDSRVDLTHPCFVGAQLREIVPMWLRSVMGPGGAAHGTCVASVIFGQPGAPVEGIVPRCRGIIIPVYGETEDGELRACSQEDLGRAISLALEAGAHFINISGGELIEAGEVDPLLAKIVNSCDQQDVAVIAATGNEGCECLHVPASLPTTLAVGASDANGRPMPFSNWDESLASHGVLAPGEGISGAIPGGGVVARSGTSFACPVVTGVAALLLSLQKLNGEKASPTAVRDAIIASAIPCGPEEQAQCERMLGGRLNVGGAYEMLFEAAVSPSENGLCTGRSTNAIRAPPARIAPAAWLRRNGNNLVGTCKSEGTAMTSKHFQRQSHDGAAVKQGVAPQMFEGPQQQGEHAQFPTPGAWTSAPGTIQGMAAAPPMAIAGQPAAVRPQGASGGCSCGCAQTPEGMSPSEKEMAPAQHDARPAQQPSTTAYHDGMPMQAPYGTRPTLTPAQRTLMHAGYPGSGGGQQMPVPAVRGVAPSEAQTQTACPCPLPNDFINCSNSQLVYVTGELGYDFITDARRDYFVQQFREMSEDHGFISQFTADLGLQPGPIYLPEDHRAMSAYLASPGGVHPDAPHGGRSPEDTASLVWILLQEGQALYALRPLQTLAFPVLVALNNFLYDQSRPEFLDDAHTKPNPERSDRVSIAGRILGDMTLYNGQQVPVLDLSARALANWNLKYLIEGVLGERPEDDQLAAAYDEDYKRLRNFLERIYYEVRNLGQAPSDRAINYLTTNLFQANEAFKDALKQKLELDSIFAEKSPLCRPRSLCFDVVMRFFDPNNRLGKALDEYRLTVDVSDLAPVGIGKTRKWAVYS